MLTACSALALAACGGDGQQVERRTETRPTIEAAVAEDLASRSDNVASLLDSGDACGAAQEAAALRSDLNAAIAENAIPELYLEDLSGLVNEIQAQIPPCDEGEKGKDKDKPKDEGDD